MHPGGKRGSEDFKTAQALLPFLLRRQKGLETGGGSQTTARLIDWAPGLSPDGKSDSESGGSGGENPQRESYLRRARPGSHTISLVGDTSPGIAEVAGREVSQNAEK